LRLETATPSETDKAITELEEKHAKEIEEMKGKLDSLTEFQSKMKDFVEIVNANKDDFQMFLAQKRRKDEVADQQHDEEQKAEILKKKQ
jgi:glutamate synthase domain-containing protein 3